MKTDTDERTDERIRARKLATAATQRYRARKRAEGLCIAGGCENPSQGSYCEECKRKSLDRAKGRRKERRKELKLYCKYKNSDGERCTELLTRKYQYYCDHHHAVSYRERRASRYQDKKQEIKAKYHEIRLEQLRKGLCAYYRCPNKHELGKTMCPQHLAKQRANSQAYKQRGIDNDAE